jgi:hypothetical protein
VPVIEQWIVDHPFWTFAVVMVVLWRVEDIARANRRG